MEKIMSFIQTLSGKHFNYLDIQQDAIEIEDIATALSHICRFAGHLPEFYSVGQHSVLTSLLVPQEFALEHFSTMLPRLTCRIFRLRLSTSYLTIAQWRFGLMLQYVRNSACRLSSTRPLNMPTW
jgi:hypothetical protein